IAIAGKSTVAAKINRRKCGKGIYVKYLSLVDYSDTANPYLLDTMVLPADGVDPGQDISDVLPDVELDGVSFPQGCGIAQYRPFVFTDDGIVVTAVNNQQPQGILELIDTHIQDMVSSWPYDGMRGVATDV